MLISSPKAGIPAIVSLTGASLSPFGVGVLIEPFVVSKTIFVMSIESVASLTGGSTVVSYNVFPVESISLTGLRSYVIVLSVVLSTGLLIEHCTI